jgi:SAM-dependent methyltransferase
MNVKFMKMFTLPCALCNSSEDYTVLYKANFKDADINIDTFSARRLPDRVHYRIVRCKNDGLVRSNPVLDDSALLALYHKSKFTYEEEIVNLTSTYLDVLSNVLPSFSKNSKILEVGCGNGFILEGLYNLGYKNVFGVEPSGEAVEKADKKVKNNIRLDRLRPGMFEDGYFDLVFFFQTFDHVKDPNVFLKICNNLLSPGGYIVSLNHDIESLFVKILKHRSPVIDIEHTFFYSQETIKRLFEKNGFKPLKVYSPANVISLKHILWLFPLPMFIKIPLMNSILLKPFFKKSLKLRIGNLCIIAKKMEW